MSTSDYTYSQNVINYNNVNNTPNQGNPIISTTTTTTTTEIIEEKVSDHTDTKNYYDGKNIQNSYNPDEQNGGDVEYYDENVDEYDDDYDYDYDDTKQNHRPMTPERKKRIQKLTVQKMIECGGDLDYFDELNRRNKYNNVSIKKKGKGKKHRNLSKKRRRSKSPNKTNKSISKSPNRRNRSKSPKKEQISRLYGKRSQSPKKNQRINQRSNSPRKNKLCPKYRKSLSPRSQQLIDEIHRSYSPKSRTLNHSKSPKSKTFTHSKSPKKRNRSPRKHKRHGKSRRKSAKKYGRSKSLRKPKKHNDKRSDSSLSSDHVVTTRTTKTTTITSSYKRPDTLSPLSKSGFGSKADRQLEHPKKKTIAMTQKSPVERDNHLNSLSTLRNTIQPGEDSHIFIPANNGHRNKREHAKSPKRYVYKGPTLKDQRRENEKKRREEERKKKADADMIEQIKRNEAERARQTELENRRMLESRTLTSNQTVRHEVGDNYIKTTTVTETTKTITTNEASLNVRQVGTSDEELVDNIEEGVEDNIDSSNVYGGYEGLDDQTGTDINEDEAETEYQFINDSNYLLIKPAKSFGNVIRVKVNDNGIEVPIADTVSKLYVADQYYEVEKPFKYEEPNTDNPQVYDVFNNYLVNKSHIESSFYGLESCKYECQTCQASKLYYHSFSMITPNLTGHSQVNLSEPINYYFNYCPSLELREVCSCGDDNYTCEYFINPFPEYLAIYIKDSDVEVEIPPELYIYDQYKFDRIHYNSYGDDKNWVANNIREDRDTINIKSLGFILYKRDDTYGNDESDGANATIQH